MAKHLDREQRAADRANDRVHGVPSRIDPRNLVREELQEIEKTRNGND